MAKLSKNQYVLPAPADIGAATSAHSHTAAAVGAAAANDPRLSDARVPNGWVDVVKAGATGNGTTDDTAAIQAAIDGSATGAVIWFPAGTYRVSQTIRLKPSRTYLGAGGRATLSTIKAAPGLTGGAVLAAQGWWDSGSYCDTQIRIEGLQVDGSNVTNAHGLVVFNYWARVVDVQVIYISGANAAGILCTDLGRNGSTVTQSSHSENQFDACRFDTFANGASAFKVESFNGYSNMDGDLRDGRFAQISGYGTLITRAAGWAVVNNHYYGIGYDAIRLERLYATRVVDNYVEGFGDQNQASPGAPTYGYYQGIMLGQILNGRPSICANNTVSTTQPSSPNGIRFTCFYLEAGASQTRAKVVFEGNAAAFYNDTAPAVPRSWAVDMDVKSGGLLEVQYGDNLIEATSWWQSTRSATASVTIREPAAQVHVHAGGDITSGTVPYARLPVGTSSSTVAAGDDARFSNARTPTTHAASHASGGSDPVTPAAIGASATGHVHSATEVTSGTLDIARVPTAASGTSSSTALVRADDARLSNSRTPTAHVHSGADLTSGTVDVARLPVGTSSTSVAAGNDARFTDARTPTAHTHTAQQVLVAARTVAYADLPTIAPLPGVALDVAYSVLTGNPTIAPAAGTDGQIIRLRMLASGAQRTPAVSTAVRTGTGITDRAMPIPSGQVGVFGLEYIGPLSLWVLFSEYIVSAS